MKKIAFRVAFSPQIGSGHMYRCSRLSLKLKKKGVRTYLFVYKKLNKKYNFISKSFSYSVNIKSSKDEIQLIKKKNIKNILIDDPNFNLLSQKKYKKNFKKLFIYQDIPKKNIADIIINHNYINQAKKIYKSLSKKNCKFFLGPKYYLMDNFKINKNKKKIISIFLGGNTPANLLNRIFNILINLKLVGFKVIVFSGIFNKNLAILKKKYPQIKIFVYRQKKQKYFFNIIASSKIFFSSGGSSIIESLFLKTPTVALSRSQNQLNNCKNLSKKNLIYFWKSTIENIQVKFFIEKLLNNNNFYLKFIKKLDIFIKKNYKNDLADKIFKKLL